MKIRYLIANAYGIGGTIRTVINQANALSAGQQHQGRGVGRDAARAR